MDQCYFEEARESLECLITDYTALDRAVPSSAAERMRPAF
jgi:hypothetical protein